MNNEAGNIVNDEMPEMAGKWRRVRNTGLGVLATFRELKPQIWKILRECM